MNKKMSPPREMRGGDHSSGLIETAGKQKIREGKTCDCFPTSLLVTLSDQTQKLLVNLILKFLPLLSCRIQ